MNPNPDTLDIRDIIDDDDGDFAGACSDPFAAFSVGDGGGGRRDVGYEIGITANGSALILICADPAHPDPDERILHLPLPGDAQLLEVMLDAIRRLVPRLRARVAEQQQRKEQSDDPSQSDPWPAWLAGLDHAG